MQRSKRARARRLGLEHYEKFTDGQLTDSWVTGLFPNVQMGMYPEDVFIMRFLPYATDPEVFYYETLILYRHVDDPAGLGEVVDQDAALLPVVQKALHWRGFSGPLGSDQEQRVRHFHRELDRYVELEKKALERAKGIEPSS